MPKKVAIVGIQGVPAKYGGFETMVENIIGENSTNVRYIVFCSHKDMADNNGLSEYKGARLCYVRPFRANGLQSTLYDIVCMLKCVGKGFDAVLVLGVSGCVFLPVFRLFYRGRLIVNIDGLEHRRAKWGRFARWFLKFSEKCAVKVADVVVADNEGIRDYVKETYSKSSELIAYGGDQVLRQVDEKRQKEILQEFGLEKGKYAFALCRIEPENNISLILEAFASLSKADVPKLKKLLFVGNWSRSEYGRELKTRYGKFDNILIQSSIYDLDTLYVLRSNAGVYIHGHSAGGTNPSLVEAMQFPVSIAAFDCVYNRATTHNLAMYFSDVMSLTACVLETKDSSASVCAMQKIAVEEYRWSVIARKYESLY